MNSHEPYCFLVIPFNNPVVNEAREKGINPATLHFGFPAYSIDQTPGPSTITAATHDRIASADFVIADLTGARPNCYYEAGYAQALGRPVIFLIRKPEKPHFDVAGFPFVEYETPADLRSRLEEAIQSRILTSHAKGGDPGDNVGQFEGKSCAYPYIVTGRVRVDSDEADKRNRAFLVDLRVRSLDNRRPVRGPVTFCLHKHFDLSRRQTVTVRAPDREAMLSDISVAGAFTVGVNLRKAGVKLEIDLSTLPGATAEFRAW